MKKLLNTLFVLSEDVYLTLDGENAVIKREDSEAGRFPIHPLDGICCFSYRGASPALMGACAKRGVYLSFFTQNGKFLARSVGESCGNVLLRRTQYRFADDREKSLGIARYMIFGKIRNARRSIGRTVRDHPMRINCEKADEVCALLGNSAKNALNSGDPDVLRGIEGDAAAAYFSFFDDMILGDKETFFFHGRNRRPPTDNVNALLSFAYALLKNDCSSALEGAGLDSFVGFFHRDKPGRNSLALDIMEELRPCVADRFVLTTINNRVIGAGDFIEEASGAVILTDDGRKKFIKAWQERKKESLIHPYLNEKIPWGLVPHVQAMLLARFLRGDLDGYPPFLWK